MTNYLYKLTYKNMHVLSSINNLQNIINELNMHGVYPQNIDHLFDDKIMQDYKLSVTSI